MPLCVLEGGVKDEIMIIHDDQHPDIVEIEAMRTGEASDETRQHVQSCEQCRETLQMLSISADVLSPQAIAVPQSADSAVMAIIDRQVGERKRKASAGRVFVFLRRVGAVAAAAAIVVGLGVWFYPGSSGPAAKPVIVSVVTHEADIDGDGKVDVVDAYLLARKLKAGDVDIACDLNHDGSVDDKDVEVIAKLAVSLSEGGAG